MCVCLRYCSQSFRKKILIYSHIAWSIIEYKQPAAAAKIVKKNHFQTK